MTPGPPSNGGWQTGSTAGPPSDGWQTAEQTNVMALRQRLWVSGYRPVPVYNFNAKVSSAGKRPFGTEWQSHARLDPPEAAIAKPDGRALNTGILCDGLRTIDIDVDDPAIADMVDRLAVERLGPAPVRWRADSPRRLRLYRAAEGEPTKRMLNGPGGKVEVLGRGQQFVAYGIHTDGQPYQWRPGDPAP
jgi:hypothetical protein